MIYLLSLQLKSSQRFRPPGDLHHVPAIYAP